MRTYTTIGLVIAVLAVAVLALPRSASACSLIPPSRDEPPRMIPPDTNWTAEDPFVWTAAGVGAADLGLAIAAGALGEQRELFPPELAVVELVWGVLHVAGAGALALGGLIELSQSCSRSADFRGTMLLATAPSLLVLGGWFLGHGIWSLRAHEQPDVEPTVAIWSEGGLIGLHGVF